MSVPDDVESTVLDKVEYVEGALTVLVEKQELDEQTYRTDREQRAIVEREFQTAIEACLDIAGLIVSALDAEMPDTYAERFVVLESAGVLTPETAERMRSAAGFRNVLTHQYGTDIDDAQVYEHLQTELTVIVKYLREIKTALDDSPE